MAEEKKPLTSLFRDDPATPEGKYLVKRRDGTVVEWPSFVLGARDEDATLCFRIYALLKLMPPDQREAFIEDMADQFAASRADTNAQNVSYFDSVMRNADKWDEYRKTHGDGDPLMGRHRKDDPATIAEMRKGHSA